MSDNVECCVCGEQVSPPYNLIGQRAYCARHFASVNKPHAGFWRTGLTQIALMAVFALVFSLIGSQLTNLSGTPLIMVGLFLAIVPTSLWLIFFYREDQLEPEPKTLLMQVFLVALVLAQVVSPIIKNVFRTSDWATTLGTSLAASILITGMTTQLITYIAVRSVIASAEFDERMDGIVYGTVAGLGVATLLNLHYIIDNQGVALGPGVIQVVTTAMAQASFAGLMGYVMAEAKFEHKPAPWVPVGFALSAIANGVFTWLISEVSSAGLNIDPLRSLAVGVLVALLAFGVLVALMRRSRTFTLRRS